VADTGLHPNFICCIIYLGFYRPDQELYIITLNMERSSPLAAMQPPSISFGQWGCRADLGSSISNQGGQYGGSISYVPGSFNFKDLSMPGASTDYFNLKPVRGSSPTASLAADLSQNFHIDQRYAKATAGKCYCSC
jgi:M-phase inducer tyrosine phosphatase